MQVVSTLGRRELAQVYAVQLRQEAWSVVECVGAVDPSAPRANKMVIVVSTQFGCPIGCAMCDAGTRYHGNLTTGEIQAQIDHVIQDWAGPEALHCAKLKVQFARMGEPAFNDAVLQVIEGLGKREDLPGLLPCIATTAPHSAWRWLDTLVRLRDEYFAGGRFQIQLSIQSTNEATRDRLIPASTIRLAELGSWASRIHRDGARKVALNFAVAEGIEIEPDALAAQFDPRHCVVKLTPLNPTDTASRNGLQTMFEPGTEARVEALVGALGSRGFDCIVSTGLPEESELRTSCGQLAYRARPDRLQMARMGVGG